MHPEIIRIDAHEPEPSLIAYAARCIHQGLVVGMPTDTFYGLAADPFNLRAVDRIYEIKSRGRHKPLSLLIESVDQAEQLAKPLPDEFYLLAEKLWPGPLTIIVQASSRLPLKVTANTGNIAIRIPAAEIPIAVIREAGVPLTATSANLHGQTECMNADAVRVQFESRLQVIVDGGPSPFSSLSTIVSLADSGGWKLMREGAIPVHKIEEILGDQ